ncbi:RNA-binding protein NOB1 [Quillaja saponaria]|uniref:RNA-binding protein NOB1 n=1 Tax=Quillaja saponaria TaxID=32244 RepID=A0AAD7PE56_QUISA|nr:RNA-binding protein NOB1 [Quillaja saponaria]
MEEAPVSAASASSASCWSNIVKAQPPPKSKDQDSTKTSRVFVESCKSTKGIAVAVVDANAIIEGGEKLHNCADKFVSVPEVMDEIRDPVSRHRLSFIPFTVETMEPTPEALNKVIKFAKATGDLQTLSDVDIKLIALTHTLETQIHGTKHLRESPPPVHTVNVRRLPEKEMPGWGSNVPNLEEWEALDNAVEDRPNANSRILPLQDLNLNVIPQDDHIEECSTGQKSEDPSENQEGGECSSRRPKKYLPKKKEVNIEGKMVAAGIDASQGKSDDNAGDWMPAVSRSTHRRFLRRKSRRESYDALSQNQDQQDLVEDIDSNVVADLGCSDEVVHQGYNDTHIDCRGSEETKIAEEKESSGKLQSNESEVLKATSDDNANATTEEVDIVREGFDHLEIESQNSESVCTPYADDNSSEQSWMLRSLSESSVACVTGDFAMQNVLLQMGLRLLAPGGTQIHQLHRWVLKCHACYTVTAEIGRMFCPKCGNGGTLRKVAVTVGENGIVLAARRPQITLRGTKFSLPLPQGGRNAITKNPILREDQLPQKFLHPKNRKKANQQGDDFFPPDNIFVHHTDKKAPLQPPIRRAAAFFGGKRNPNDNHFSRSKHK